jgi:FKBP-type peptidyl-prolyl cis-trans isomerase FklB
LGEEFLAANSKKTDVVTLPSGLQYKQLKAGTGKKPSLRDKVTTHYHGTLINGTVFDSSYERNDPATFPVNGVIPGWTEALQLMNEGSIWELYIPSNLAYGRRGAGGDIGPNETLIFKVELLQVH